MEAQSQKQLTQSLNYAPPSTNKAYGGTKSSDQNQYTATKLQRMNCRQLSPS